MKNVILVLSFSLVILYFILSNYAMCLLWFCIMVLAKLNK